MTLFSFNIIILKGNQFVSTNASCNLCDEHPSSPTYYHKS